MKNKLDNGIVFIYYFIYIYIYIYQVYSKPSLFNSYYKFQKLKQLRTLRIFFLHFLSICKTSHEQKSNVTAGKVYYTEAFTV